ncbi:hypothetical protein B0H13DRAFT_1862745 [Mycena leptocephala]|nr:hypothetical protein B0H13DRAFT_1862745 [Mycena leptocephala]
MSLRTGLVRAARLARIPHPRLPPTLFIRASHDAYTDSRLEHFLLPLRYPEEPNAVRRHYLPLVAELQRIKAEPSSPPLPPLLTRTQLITIIDLLATSGRPPDLECIRAMFTHLPTYFDVAITPELHSVVIKALLRQGWDFLAQKWISEIPQLPPHVEPTLDHFHTFLKECPNHVSNTALRDMVARKMRRADAPTRADPAILELMLNHFIEHGSLVGADTIRQNYVAQFPNVLTPEEELRDAWKKQLAAASHESGVEHSLKVFRGYGPSILDASKNIQDLRTVEEALGVRADASEYAVLVHNNIRVGQVQDALAVYEEAKKSGVVPVAGLVAPIIRSLAAAEKKLAAVHNANLDTALALYSDIEEAFAIPAPDSAEALAANSHSEHSQGPDIDVYTSLFRGLALSSNVKSAYPIAEALSVDMKSRGITVTSAIKASQLILNMRSAENLDEAFIRYRKSRADLAESGYHAVLHAFSRISRSLGHPDMLEYYLLIVGDMRLAGFTITDRQFAEIGNMRRYEWRKRQRNPLLPRPANMFDDLLDAVRQIHDLITVDPSIKPERIAWNQLIDTYQRLGSFPEAYRVQIWAIAVSIILDGCGFAGEHAIAKQIVGNLQAANYVFNLHNWNSYIECLCRLNDMSEALKVICTVMGTVAQPLNQSPRRSR